MRRPVTALMAASAVALGGCSSDDGDTVEVTQPVADDADTAASTPGGEPGTDGATQSPANGEDEATTADEDAAESGTDETNVDGVEGGAEGQAAADRARVFLLALIDADPAACELMLSFSDSSRPMTDVEADLELCRAELPDTMTTAVDAEGLGEEGRRVLEAMQITGADIDGDGDDTTAVIDQDNYSPLFAESIGEASITLVKVDDEWFIDVDRFLQTP